eukprot:CAMPEP_0117455906 /NCGR_PEP_ID=MMETSP0759-20121206/11603_1 /TAXON_ID=63605 /ORGANISM="Percolomonas cosmopolitus, Strain WS" /LENGTH=361 /DNA_ID=CAMNT_0005249229 /DNA_START=48 /DNA_END=1133 /DNA_ORIENTATION=+
MGNSQGTTPFQATTLITVKPIQCKQVSAMPFKVDHQNRVPAVCSHANFSTRKHQSTFAESVKQKIGNLTAASTKVLPLNRKKIQNSFVRHEAAVHSRQSPTKHLQKRKRFSLTTPAKKKKREGISATSLKNEYYVQRLAFNIFAQGRSKVTVGDLVRFFEEHTNESYIEVREMLHRACNDYELTFDDFRRILAHNDEQFALGRAALPGSSFVHDNLVNDIKSLDRSKVLEARKLMYGVYKTHFAKSFTTQRKECALKRPQLDLIVQDAQSAHPYKTLKRSISEGTTLNSLERDYHQLRQAFSFFDQSQLGEIDSHDIKRVMNLMDLKVKPSQLSDLLHCVGKNKKGALTFSEFVTLYRMCS